MAKAKKESSAPEIAPVAEVIPANGPIMPEVPPPIQVEAPRDRLWELYVARVAKAETVHTMRRDGRSIFRDAFIEAKVALEVFDKCISESQEG